MKKIWYVQGRVRRPARLGSGGKGDLIRRVKDENVEELDSPFGI